MKINNVEVVWIRLANFSKLCLISDPPISSQNSLNELNDPKEPENINYSKSPKIPYKKVSDKMAYSKSVDPDQTAPSGAV